MKQADKLGCNLHDSPFAVRHSNLVVALELFKGPPCDIFSEYERAISKAPARSHQRPLLNVSVRG